MKRFGIIAMGALALAFSPVRQIVHGTVFGQKPNITQVVQAGKLETYMGRRTRATATVKGKVLNVTKTKGGWFDLDAGSGKVISAHFKNAGIDLPAGLKGHTVTADGIVQRPLNPSAMQHYAGDDKQQPSTRVGGETGKQSLTMEVRGLVVE